jgi:pimeloyl-ACP methyl ester carboxylesterase
MIRLRDGRTLAYAEWGPSDGFPVLGFHGTPNSRLVHLGAESRKRAGVRLILPDRPSLGRSDFQPGRRLLDWPADVEEFADSLGIDRFGVFGVSGGRPHALACGYALRDRVSALGLVSAVGPAFDDRDVSTAMPRNWSKFTELARRDAESAAAQVWGECEAELGPSLREHRRGPAPQPPGLQNATSCTTSPSRIVWMDTPWYLSTGRRVPPLPNLHSNQIRSSRIAKSRSSCTGSSSSSNISA